MLNLIESFVVKPPCTFSDNSQIMCWIKCFLSDLSQPKSKHSMFPLLKQHNIWNLDSAQHFITTLKTNEFQSKLSAFEQTYFVSDNTGVEEATE